MPQNPVAQDRARPDQAELTTWFMKWVQIFQRSASTEKSFVTFIRQLQKEGILNGDEQFSFFRICAEASVESYRKQALTGNMTNIFQPVDALSRLIALLIEYRGDTMAPTSQDHVKSSTCPRSSRLLYLFSHMPTSNKDPISSKSRSSDPSPAY